MHIKSTLINRAGQTLLVEYSESDPLAGLEGKILHGVHGFCFCGGKLVIVWAPAKNYWTPPGGGIEPGETYEQALVREIKESGNEVFLDLKFHDIPNTVAKAVSPLDRLGHPPQAKTKRPASR